MGAIALASNPILHARTKHIELDIHFVWDKVLAKEIELKHVPTLDQIADIFTKPLSRQSYVKLRDRLGVVSLASLGLKGRVREPCEPKLHKTKVECEAKLDGSRTTTRDLIEYGQAAPANSEDLVDKVANTLKDHKRTWIDVALQGIMKKSN